MGMTVKPPLNAAEMALVSAAREAAGSLPGTVAIHESRVIAAERLAAGLPTRRVESWHYTDLKSRLRIPAALAAPAKARPVVDGSTVLAVKDGVAAAAAMPEGMVARRFAEALADGAAAPLMTERGDDDAIGRISVALAGDGFMIELAPGAAPAYPVEIQIRSGALAHQRLAARFGAGSRAIVIERQMGGGLATTVTDLDLAEGAVIDWIVLQERDESAVQLGQVNARLGTDAKLSLWLLNEGGKLVRQEAHVRSAGEGSSFRLRGVNLIAGDSHVDVTMTLTHEVENTGSTAVVRNVVTGRGEGAFQGMIRVAQAAQKTDARMACNTLLLSDEASFSAKPELEIFADDVACGHGATVAEIDRNLLFYLMARGIPEKEARGLLVKAFVAELIEEIEDEALVEAFEDRLSAWFTAHG